VLGSEEKILQEFFGHGPITSFLKDPEVNEVLVNSYDEIWIERSGDLSRTEMAFTSEESLRRYMRRLLAARGRKIDNLSPFADCVTEDGFRLHAVISPISRRGTCLSIRKPKTGGWNLDSLSSIGALSKDCAKYLAAAVADKKNIFLCGGTGSGKTSLLGALLSQVTPTERIICLEDIAEIQCSHPHFIQMEARSANQEGEGEQNLRRLLRESLRMRPDRLVIGESRGDEALDLLMALNTGHAGSMGTIHANSPRDALARLELLAMLGAKNLSEGAVKSLIASAIHVVVCLSRIEGKRKVSSIAELKGVDAGCYRLKELFHSEMDSF